LGNYRLDNNLPQAQAGHWRKSPVAWLGSWSLMATHTMKRITILVLVCITWCGIAADAPICTDQSNIQGVWLADSASDDGQKVKEAAGFQYVFKGDKLTIRDASGEEMKYSFKLDTASNPKLFVLQPEQMLTNDEMICNVAYELKGDSLKVALACPGSRPTEISDKNNQMLIILKRKNPGNSTAPEQHSQTNNRATPLH
jgi:uncharacterized protein (TIGR03067 family)